VKITEKQVSGKQAPYFNVLMRGVSYDLIFLGPGILHLLCSSGHGTLVQLIAIHLQKQ